MRGKRAPIDPVCKSAEEYDYADATVVYLYNPFNERLTERVIQKVSESYLQRPRMIHVVYANPVHEKIFEKQKWLEKYGEWPTSAYPVFGYPVSFWRSLKS